VKQGFVDQKSGDRSLCSQMECPKNAEGAFEGSRRNRTLAFTLFSLILIVQCCILLVAAVLKLWILLFDPFYLLQLGLRIEPYWLIVVFELTILVLLLTIKDQGLRWLVLFGTAFTFLVSSIVQSLYGITDCGCFGKISFPTGVIPAYNAALLLVLLYFKQHLGISIATSSTKSLAWRFGGFSPLSDRGSFNSTLLFLLLVSTCGIVFFNIVVLQDSKIEVGKAETLDSESQDSESTPTLKPKSVYYHDVDLGMIRPGDRITHTFSITNEFDQSVQLTKVQTQCRCSLARPQKESLAPGESAEFTLFLAAPDDSVDFEQTMTLHYWPPSAPTHVVNVSASVRNEVWLSKKEVDFGKLGFSATKTQVIDIINFGDREWKDITFQADAPWLNAKLDTLGNVHLFGKDRQFASVAISVDATQIPSGSNQASLQVGVDEVDELNQTIPVSLIVMAPYRAVPAEFVITSLEPTGYQREISLFFTSGFEVPDKVEVVLNSDDQQEDLLCMTWSWRKLHDGEGRLSLDLKPGSKSSPGIYRESLKISWRDNASHCELDVPLMVKVEE
jgi:hypothetical protein